MANRVIGYIPPKKKGGKPAGSAGEKPAEPKIGAGKPAED